MRHFLLFLLLGLCGCSIFGRPVSVEIKNPSAVDSRAEVVEVMWCDVQYCVSYPDNVVVYNPAGEEVASQLVFAEDGSLKSILFQVDVAAGEAVQYKIGRGKRADYESKVFGRYVPERMDDYAWENNLTAYRIYGPSLKDPRTQGVDVWVKNTSKLIIDEWFARNDYHHNYGEGMDCYKVGNTLGGGALAVVSDGKLQLSGNYTTQECVINGPLRTSAVFSYDAMEVAGGKVVMHRTITLDADSRFTRQEYSFDGFDGEIDVVAGVITHDVKQRSDGANFVAITEAASDTKDAERDGNISLAVILDGGAQCEDINSHAVVTKRVKAGDKIVMLNGSGWSQGGVGSHDEWLQQVTTAAVRLSQPLEVKVVK
ncbi:MAG: DUF4861 family protein [Alistipes sp.]|nr:DUF4861 family protein [Alistipes sp.]